MRTAATWLLLILLLPSCLLFAQDRVRGSIEGRITDSETGKPLFGANIMVQGTTLGAAADITGAFRIERLPPGRYTLRISMMGYEKESREIQIAAGERLELAIELKPTVITQQTLLVTATKRKQQIEDAPTSVEILSEDAIRTRSSPDLDDMLENTTGFSVIDGQIDIRGSTGFNWTAGSRVLVMLDGTAFINGDSQGISWDAIPVDLVDHVEIVKGAGSALYGSNAMAGVINVITKEPSPVPNTYYKLSWGFFDEPAYAQWVWTDRFVTQQKIRFFSPDPMFPRNTLCYEGFDLSHSRTLGPAGLVLTLGRKRSSGYTENGDYSRWNALAKLKLRFSSQTSLTILGNWARNSHGDIIQWESQAHAMEVPGEELGNRILNEKGHVQANFHHLVNRSLAYTVKANFYRSHWQNYFNDNNDYSITDRYGLEFQGDAFLGKQSLTFGGEAVAYHANASIYGNQDVQDYAVYAEDEIRFSSLATAILGTRYDYHRVSGVTSDQQISPRLGLVLNPLTFLSMRLSGGYGFRAPSIAEVFANTSVSGFRVIPNPELTSAERAWNGEIGMRLVLALPHALRSPVSYGENPALHLAQVLDPSLIIDCAFFYSLYHNMIDVDINPEYMAFQFVNAGNARIWGLEPSIQAGFFRNLFTLHLGYTYLDPLDLESGKTLKYRARHRLVTGAELRLWKFVLGMDYRYASRIEEVVNVFYGDQRVPMHVMDGRIAFLLGKSRIGFEVNNLRNYHYSLRQRFLEPVRSYTFSWKGEL